MKRGVIVAVSLLVAAAGYFGWRGFQSTDEREIRAALAALASDFNASTTDGLGTVAHAAQLGSAFAEDAVIDLGPGAMPIQGRNTMIGMAERLQPRTAAFRVALDDLGIEMGEGNRTADVTLTVSFIRRSFTTGEESIDAREFALVMNKTDGRWRIARATAIDTFR
jgi:hypothetical protein